MVYKYYLECKKGCDIDYVIETDIKDLAKKTKPICPKCGRRVYQNDSLTKTIKMKVVKKKKKK